MQTNVKPRDEIPASSSTTNTTDAITFVSKKKKQHRRSAKRRHGDAASSAQQQHGSAPPVAAVVDDDSLPVQKREDVAPINAVGFEPGGIQYVRPIPDPVPVKDQRYWVLSYVTSGGEKIRSKNTMVKCSGAFADEDAARARAQEIRDNDPRISVFVVDMYVFVSVPIPDQVFASIPKHYDDERLDRIMRQSQLEVKRDGDRLAQRTRADKEKALRNLRKAKGDETYVPPEHEDLAAKHLADQEAYDRRAREATVDVVDIVAAMTELREDAAASSSAVADADSAAATDADPATATPTAVDSTQDVCVKLLAKLKLKLDERAEREAKKRAASAAAATAAGLEVPPHAPSGEEPTQTESPLDSQQQTL